MKAEIVSVGTELLLGAITDTNATYLAQRLSALGIDLYHVTQVGDNLGRIVETLRHAWERSDLIITTGGLGPTSDDITRESIAELLSETLKVEPELEENLRNFYRRRALPMPASNLKQATLIPSARSLPNPVGTAPGWLTRGAYEGQPRMIVSMPGVPYEMRRMWEHEVEPTLRALSDNVIISRTLKTLGVGESRIEEMVSDLMQSTDPTLAPYAKNDGVHLRITAKARDPREAEEKIGRMESSVRELLGDSVYGADGDTPASVVGSLLDELGRRFLLLELGEGAIGALGPYLGAHPLCRGTVSVADTGALSRLFGWTALPSTVEDAARSLVSLDAPLVFTVAATSEACADAGARSFEAETILALRGSEGTVAQARAAWRSAPSEGARLAGLAALNFLRKELYWLLLATERSAV